jgi:hypothetical protein
VGFWNELNLNRQTATWMSHEMIGLVVVSVGVVAGEYLPGSLFLWAMLFGWLQAFYFGLVREPQDRVTHQATGDWDKPLAQGVTPKVDMYGDQVGNWGIAGTATILFLATIWWGIVLIVALAITALLLTMAFKHWHDARRRNNAA